ncbi:hypothetical protein HBH56_083340 [Parastagonospora nodorum]|uniref:Chromo domain-containing protein n=1 Tax=Phaeosphaeria nodorum (strain SN15 / ATCC MYA-4574 / FGSC 10173) TaxID=321614 RepID=A0A7U2F0W7_PHANO|nr:hypothetical protein HBH56_083340 [Parastagonospora nodorum]QRC96729.1 hypothetical protein JI435_016210 [Parastagonospora nodorum SN15]KAH3929863.1 hypothetical protein HBH54_118490 [Parastagonospora nodorum]KAH3955819.1 hypothetical protein HBH53_006070 [Parastagonospora nodorum]KAH3976797.1 hypothetical protein HBH51_075440 [Parastagonospora nodorum]
MVGSDLEYDTDNISLTSTVESQHDQIYDIKRILSEGWGKDEQGEDVMKYLIEWEGYPMKDCTWEPEYNLEETGLLTPWAKQKARMGSKAFQKFTEDNEDAFEKAFEKHKRLHATRKQKRAKKRNRPRRNKRVVEDSSSEDDVTERQQNLAGQAKSKSSEAVPTHNQEVYNSLFVDSQDSNPLGQPPTLDQLERDSAAEGPPAARTPFIESSTDDGDDTASDDSSDSLLAELASKAKGQTRSKSRGKKATGLASPILAPTRSRQKVPKPSPQPAAPAANQPTVEAAVQKPAKPVRTLTAPVVSKTSDSTVVKQVERRPSESAIQVLTATTSTENVTSAPDRSIGTVGAASAQNPTPATTPATTTVSTGARKAHVSGVPPSSRKTGTASKAAPPIKFTNQKQEPQRSKWDTKGVLYNKAHFRAKAEQRSRYEGTPDPTVLEFVGSGPPNLVKPKPSRPVDDPYSRRETGNRRVESSDEDESTGRGGHQYFDLMHDWEKDKLPLVCPEWRLSSNCPYTARICKYLHRNKDGNGRDIEVANIDGKLPPKMRIPPVTCFYWMTGPRGCRKTDAECKYAHYNTGWLPIENDTAPIRIDPDEKPLSEQRQEIARPSAGRIPSTNRNTGPIPTGPKEGLPSGQRPVAGWNVKKTCWYWANGGCEKSDELCSFHHYDTGVVADLGRRRESSKSSSPCYYFLRGLCKFSAEQCRFLHTDPNHPNTDLNAIATTTQEPRQHFTAGHASRMHHDEAVDTHMHDTDEQPSAPLRRPTVDEQNQSPSALSPLSTVSNRLRTFKAPTTPPRTVPTSLEMKLKIEKVLKTDFSHMFQWSQDEGEKSMLDRKAFLLYHPVDNQEELELMTRWLMLHHVEVRNAYFEGAWRQYAREHVEQKSSSGILVVHPDFESFSELKDFGKVLRNQVRVWSVGRQEGIEYDPATSLPPPEKCQECIELFPAGGFIYITDDVFEVRPRQALEIVKLFIAKIESLRDPEYAQNPWQEVDNINLHWRICVRPELMEYLFAKCEEQAKALEAGESDAMARAELYTLLSDTEYIEQDSPVLPLSQKADKFPIMSERRVVAKNEPIDYFNSLARSHEKANLRMIRYYTALHMDLRRDYRHFYIVHTDPFSTPAKQWLRECSTITDVINPERCILELSKDGHDGEERCFDFYEKYLMPTKDETVPLTQVKQVTLIQEEDVMESQSSLESGEICSS